VHHRLRFSDENEKPRITPARGYKRAQLPEWGKREELRAKGNEPAPWSRISLACQAKREEKLLETIRKLDSPALREKETDTQGSPSRSLPAEKINNER